MAKRLLILMAAAVMAAGCNQNPPSVGETGTITPEDDPTEPVDPYDGMHITYLPVDSLAYIFICAVGCNVPSSTALVRWEIVDPGLDEPYQKITHSSEIISYHFHAPGKARITVTLEEYLNKSTSITIDVY